jgi:ATP-binding cassette subfamily F protein 3
MNLLQVVGGTKQIGPRTLFEKISLSVNADEHIGVIGPNGAGKTTLFKIIAGLSELDEGHIVRSQQLRLGYLQQESDWDLAVTVDQFIQEKAVKPVWEIKRWAPKLGLENRIFERPISELSGGYRMRVQLLKLLAQDPNLLLLDEPTNFLDLETTLVLEQFLQNYQGAFMMISHDREFLKRTTDHIVEIEAGDVSKFPGNIEDYFEQKAELRLQAEAQAKNIETKRAHLMSFVERFRAKATKAKQAQSRLKQVQKMESIEIKTLPVREKILIPAPYHK